MPHFKGARAILGITEESTEKEIKKAYHKVSRENHADKTDCPKAKKKMNKITEAYEALTDKEKGEAYIKKVKERNREVIKATEKKNRTKKRRKNK